MNFDYLFTVKRIVARLKAMRELKDFTWKDLENEKERKMTHFPCNFPLKGFVSRDSSLYEAIIYLARFEELTREHSISPMAAVHGPPGSGKSKFLAMLAGCIDVRKEDLRPDEWTLYSWVQERLKGYVPLAITFSSFSAPRKDEKDPYLALAIRALFS